LLYGQRNLLLQIQVVAFKVSKVTNKKINAKGELGYTLACHLLWGLNKISDASRTNTNDKWPLVIRQAMPQVCCTTDAHSPLSTFVYSPRWPQIPFWRKNRSDTPLQDSDTDDLSHMCTCFGVLLS
jgi:hypothetical protein